METILFLAHTEADGTLGNGGLEALGASVELKQALGAELVAGVYGAETGLAANVIANCGALRFLAVSGKQFSSARYATDAAACEILIRAAHATIVIASSTSRNSRVLAGVARRLDGYADTHVTSIASNQTTPVVTRWFYRQRIEGSFTRAHRPWILLLDPGSHAAWTGEAGTVTPERIDVPITDALTRTTVKGFVTPPADQQTIKPEARLLFVAGAGWTKKQKDGQTHVPEAETIILNFLNSAQASLGGSKSLVDLSGENQAALPFMTHLNQVGQTGASPRHPKGLATCCHGEEPHTVGWRFIGERRAINLDANCGWARGKADVLYVADAFEVMKKVNALLAKRSLLGNTSA